MDNKRKRYRYGAKLLDLFLSDQLMDCVLSYRISKIANRNLIITWEHQMGYLNEYIPNRSSIHILRALGTSDMDIDIINNIKACLLLYHVFMDGPDNSIALIRYNKSYFNPDIGWIIDGSDYEIVLNPRQMNPVCNYLIGLK